MTLYGRIMLAWFYTCGLLGPALAPQQTPRHLIGYIVLGHVVGFCIGCFASGAGGKAEAWVSLTRALYYTLPLGLVGLVAGFWIGFGHLMWDRFGLVATAPIVTSWGFLVAGFVALYQVHSEQLKNFRAATRGAGNAAGGRNA